MKKLLTLFLLFSTLIIHAASPSYQQVTNVLQAPLVKTNDTRRLNLTNANNVFGGDGSGLTGISGGAPLNGTNAWTGTNTFSSTVNLANTNNLVTHYSANAQGASIKLRKARGSEGTPTVVLTEDSMGDLMWYGYTSLGWWPSAMIRNKAVSVPTDQHVTSQLRFYVGSVHTPSYLTNILTLAGGDPSPFTELATPLILTTSPDGAQTFILQNSSWPDPNCGIEGSTAGGGITFFQGGLARANIGSGGLTITRSSAGTAAAFGYSGFNFVVGADGSGHAWAGTVGNSDVYFLANNAERWRIMATGHLIPAANVTYDIGSASVYVRTQYSGTVVANSLIAKNLTFQTNADIIIANTTLYFTNGGKTFRLSAEQLP